MIISEWGESIVGFWDHTTDLSKSERVKPGTEYEFVHEIDVLEPMSAHDWSVVIGQVVNRWREEVPPGTELEYVSFERSTPKIRIQFKTLQSASPTLFGMTIAEIIKSVLIPVVVGAVIVYAGYEAIKIVSTVGREVKSVFEDPTEDPAKTLLIVGIALGGVMILKD